MKIVVDRYGQVQRVAVVRHGELVDLYCDRIDRPPLTGALVAARVTRIVADLRAAFVSLGADHANGMLALTGRREAQPSGGDRLLLQVKADPTGAKAARVSSDIALTGRCLVHTPRAPGVRVSRRLEAGAALRAQLTDQLPGTGWILRRRAAQMPLDQVLMEAEWLYGLWQAALGLFQQGTQGLLLSGPDALARAVVNLATPGNGASLQPSLTVQRGPVAAQAVAWCRAAAPDLLSDLEPIAGLAQPFDAYGLEDAFSRLTEPTLPLPGGGRVTIERTQALTAIDVDGGDAGNRESVNRQALDTVARQLRLRNLSGVILVDVLNLASGSARDRLITRLKAQVAEDPVETTVHGMTRLGLIELSRNRQTPSLSELLTPGWDQHATGERPVTEGQR